MIKLDEKYHRDDFLDFIQTNFITDFKRDIRSVTTSDSSTIEKAYSLGRSDTLDLQVFEFEFNGSANKRVALTKDAFRVLKQSATFQALGVFHSSDSSDWRLSLLTFNPEKTPEGKVTSNFSNPKRYSFVLGPNAKVNTANRFIIKNGQVKDFNDLLSRFNVEIVTKEFFSHYKDLFDRLVGYLNKDHAFQIFASRNGVETSNFAKKLLGQIVFIYFLQRKGWLGATQGQAISNGDKNFLRSLFNKSFTTGENFYNEYLEHLFYGALNKQPEKAGSFYRQYFECQIPFLNGGLFEPLKNYDWEHDFLLIPNDIFSNNPENPSKGEGILDIFDLYNFTVDENSLFDQEVAVDPEMLGKVFENLLEENARKGKGTYYTPREIVSYMCQESLINYLITNAEISENEVGKITNWGTFIVDEEDIAKMENDPRHSTQVVDTKVLAFREDTYKKIDELLTNIKVVDPACGSGAFLVGMLQNIVHSRQVLQLFTNENKSEYDLKKETIQNCIYGVDIDPGAVEIAKLRLWLSLVVDYQLEEIEPLPNLDYKIMQGNSLLEELVLGDSTIKLYEQRSSQNSNTQKRMKNLFEEDPQLAMFDDGKKEQSLKNMKALQVKYFSQSDAGEKKKIRSQIDKIEHELIDACVKVEVERLSSQRINIRTIPGIGLLPEDAKKLTNIMSKESQIMAVLDELKKTGTKPFFLWHLHFSEVFENKGGFDVIIANPPYGADIDKDSLNAIKMRLVDTKNTNSAALFIDQCKNKLLNRQGTLCFIVPKSLLFSEVWFDLVKALLNKVRIIVDVEKAFDNVLLEQTVFLYGNSTSNELYFARKFINDKFVNSIYIPYEVVSKFKAWICDVTKLELKIANKIIDDSATILLSDMSETKRGMGLQKCLKSTGKVPVIGGKNIFRFGFNGNKGYLSIEELSSSKTKSSFLQQPKIMTQNIVAHIQNPAPHLKITATYDDIGNCFSLDTVNNTVITSKLNPKYILGIINSSLISWYAYKFIYCSAIRTMHFDSYYVGKIPIISTSGEKQNEIINLVDKILKLTKLDNYASNKESKLCVSGYEKQIDQLVYKLYGLTGEEVKIVDGSIK